MLQLKKIVKTYDAADTKVEALRNIDLCFRESEFVSVLGPSGCGKTTLLNIIGGLDRYTTGDLIINGKSTKLFTRSDWDTYRNHSVGFVFQSYNLIPHQTVLSNVELALTLSGVSKSERRRRAVEALEKVGLGDQLKKKPCHMSGGQMQRVAIARALVNDPDILLADEPTGALDSETSIQVMEILKAIAQSKLIIMVTHNKELAEQYSTRIVRLLDGAIQDDSNPFTVQAQAAIPAAAAKTTEKKRNTKKNKTSMSFFTALSLSFNNLMTKRTRTLLTSFAGSIGIIGIALILAMSTGIQSYISSVQRETLSSYPITINETDSDLMSLLSSMASESGENNASKHDNSAVYSNPQLYNMFNAFFASETKENDLAAFKKFLDAELNEQTRQTDLYTHLKALQYKYNVPMNFYVKSQDGNYISADVATAFKNFAETGGSGNEMMYNMLSTQMSAIDIWDELTPGLNNEAVSTLASEQYELVHGSWPEKANEIVLMLDSNNEISDIAFFALGIISAQEVNEIFGAAVNNTPLDIPDRQLSYEEVCNISFKLLLNSDYYSDDNSDGIWEYIGNDEQLMELKIKNALDLNIVGVVRATEENMSSMTTFGYTSALTEYVLEATAKSGIVSAQLSKENENFDVLTGLPFIITDAVNPSDEYKAQAIKEYFASLNEEEKTELYTKIISTPSDEYVNTTVDAYMANYTTRESLEQLIAETYGMSLEVMQTYLSAYSDEELEVLIREQLTSVVIQAYKQQMENQIEEIMKTPSDEELSMIIARIISALTTREMKSYYILNAWTGSTTMTQEAISAYLAGLSDSELEAALLSAAEAEARATYADSYTLFADGGYKKIAALFDSEYASEEDITVLSEYYDLYMPSTTAPTTFDETLQAIGYVDINSPSSINLYADNFEGKDAISKVIDIYNSTADEQTKISYTDYFALLLSGVTDIIDGISIGLILFVSVSLVVSSIMIGIITYISVLERTKEIGILRAIGASKRDISLVFNAETLLVGLTAGLIGIGISLACCPLITYLVKTLSGVTDIRAFLEPEACIILVAISMALTLIAGLIPSGIAAKKDPVEALRSE